jgi:CheY-like chemotaxis protein
MPEMDGLEAASVLMQMDTGIPVVAMTANIMDGDMDIYKRNGMDDCVGKPFTSQELWNCLANYCIMRPPHTY